MSYSKPTIEVQRKISVLCVKENSIYNEIPNLDLWGKYRNAYNFKGTTPVIAHPPCQQWSRLRYFSRANKEEKDLAHFCLEQVRKNGGILEHPHGSNFFKEAGIRPTISINQSWFGFSCKKTTLLYFHHYRPIAHPLNFDRIEKRINDLTSRKDKRSEMSLKFAKWLTECIWNIE